MYMSNKNKTIRGKPGLLENIAGKGALATGGTGIAIPLAAGTAYAADNYINSSFLTKAADFLGFIPYRTMIDYGVENLGEAVAAGFGLTGAGLLLNGARRAMKGKRIEKNKKIANQRGLQYK